MMASLNRPAVVREDVGLLDLPPHYPVNDLDRTV